MRSSPWPHWRLNLFRYNFLHGTAPDDYELDAWSPTHSPSFHDPRRFGYGHMGEEPDHSFLPAPHDSVSKQSRAAREASVERVAHATLPYRRAK